MPVTIDKAKGKNELRPVWWDETPQTGEPAGQPGSAPRGALCLIDQTRLPSELVTIRAASARDVWDAIKTLQVRGAPAIGIAAAYGVIVGLDEARPSDATWRAGARKTCEYLTSARPTAVNLAWALNRMLRRAEQLGHRTWTDARAALLAEAHTIRNEDAAMCRAIGRAGEHLIGDGFGVLTHCNAGALATSEYGTALAVVYTAAERGRRFRVYADETRPLLQGARLTAWELMRAGIDTMLICDNMAAQLMVERKVNVVITGADRIAANGDTANKIGTYGLAVLAAAHQIPFYIAAPRSTFDPSTADGAGIPIEQRDPQELRRIGGVAIAPEDVACYCPAFDVTPARLITGIITDRGLISPVNSRNIAPVIGAA